MSLDAIMPLASRIHQRIIAAMKTSDFDYTLPQELIAAEPLQNRSDSRLLAMDRRSGVLKDAQFTDLLQLLNPEDLLVFNDTKVIPARIWGQKTTGAKVEIMIERIVSSSLAWAHVRCNRSPKSGAVINITEDCAINVVDRDDALFLLKVDDEIDWPQLMTQHGHMPLPPYINRDVKPLDKTRYQTVYAKKPGAVAAPTAGLHFDESLLKKIAAMGVSTTTVTLHVGAGTFQPVRGESLSNHVMHAEQVWIEDSCVQAVIDCRQRGGRVIAVGTTAMRSLESAAQQGQLSTFADETRLFITPGYEFKVCDGLVTNFHLPRSTLLMLVSAFSTRENILAAYQHAIAQQYRFFSYGDAMWIA